MSDPDSEQNPRGLYPHRVARTDQYLATAAERLDRLLGDYAKAVTEDGPTTAATHVSLAMRLGFDHVDVAWIAMVAMQRLHAQKEKADDEESR
jgi:hypothetical protein